MARRPLKKRIFPSLAPIKVDAKDEDVEMVTENFSTSEGNFEVLCSVVSVLPVEYDVVTEVTYTEEEYSAKDMAGHKPVCYYVMNDGCVEEQNAIFERPDRDDELFEPSFYKGKSWCQQGTGQQWRYS